MVPRFSARFVRALIRRLTFGAIPVGSAGLRKVSKRLRNRIGSVHALVYWAILVVEVTRC
ncbi:hypothetical protein AS9A_1287 [Hoyosella subflava DQS3-9A1]|uniref:Uncharacterized protein n=1 Tax=Hoyosella subflava (strain DSM 45089 / JCM 17490 / NBRC 109087 / DQS3-9A1) TaxID=443218 RepID=F6EFC6_HOYSD|nr:hypothetical protein AS9A_1287 [Hoyosella subflava DQS3-9A1]